MRLLGGARIENSRVEGYGVFSQVLSQFQAPGLMVGRRGRIHAENVITRNRTVQLESFVLQALLPGRVDHVRAILVDRIENRVPAAANRDSKKVLIIRLVHTVHSGKIESSKLQSKYAYPMVGQAADHVLKPGVGVGLETRPT